MVTGNKIYLRDITLDDTDNILRWRNSDRVRKNFIYQTCLTKDAHEHWYETMIKTGKVVQFIICDKKNDMPVGSVYLRDIDYSNNKAEYGIFIGETSATGKGFGTEAARLITEYGFSELKLHKIFLRVFADNLGAVKSYEKAGFVKEAYMKDDVKIDGKYYDMVFMAIINDK